MMMISLSTFERNISVLEIPYFLLELSSVIFFFIPLIVMICLYLALFQRIRQTSLVVLGFSRTEMESRLRNRRSILKMLGNFLPSDRISFISSRSAVVVFSFFLCWAPFHAQRLMYVLQHYRYNLLDFLIEFLTRK